MWLPAWWISWRRRVKAAGAFGFFEQAVVDRHGLGCLAGACGCHGGEVNEVFPEGLFELGHEGVSA